MRPPFARRSQEKSVIRGSSTVHSPHYVWSVGRPISPTPLSPAEKSGMASCCSKYEDVQGGACPRATSLLASSLPLPLHPSRSSQPPVIHTPPRCLPKPRPWLGDSPVPEPGQLLLIFLATLVCHFPQEAILGLPTRSNLPLQPLLE